ncbi:hypothetical protein PR202_gb21875 [Eleusine coracana subsp. coracana]|uniref:Uncharacterized protein n=1 Tax=Eleusine coracana subsp. coracana TaxID=191504 RepID=A0AAV5FF48_ELECO|nr:hypothetical protein PR202_gb21875 [Eleusine coracana subsp. coracana]
MVTSNLPRNKLTSRGYRLAHLLNGEREERDADPDEQYGGDGEADGRGPRECHGREQPPPPRPEPAAVLPSVRSLRAVRPAPRPPPRPKAHHRGACQICLPGSALPASSAFRAPVV